MRACPRREAIPGDMMEMAGACSWASAGRSTNMATFGFLLMSLLATGIALAQEQPAEQPSAMQHHNGGFMQGGMHHPAAKGVREDVRVDEALHICHLRVGSVSLLAHTSV